MSSSSGRQGLPSINPPEKTKKTQSRELPTLHRATNALKVPRGRRNLRSSQPGQQTPRGDEQDHSVHRRVGRRSSVGVDDADSFRNWNSEGGRPKRERTLSDRSSTGRLLHRSSINSVGELIPFQRAPRDGSYELQLPVGRKAMSQRLVKRSSGGDLTNAGQRQSVSLQGRPRETDDKSSSSLSGLIDKAPSLALDGQKRPSVKGSLTSDDRREGSRPKRKSTQDAQTSSRKGPSDAKPRLQSHNESTRQVRTLSPEKLLATNPEPSGSNASTITTVGNAREITATSDKETPTTSTSYEHDGITSPSPFNDFISDDDEDKPIRKVTSPSTEFKVAAEQQSTNSTQPFTSTLATTGTSSFTHTSLSNESTEETSTPSSNQSNRGSPEHLNTSQQPNSVVRRRLNSSEIADRSQLQASHISAPSLSLPQLRQTLRTEGNSDTEEATSGNPTAAQSNIRVGGSEASSSISPPIPPPPSSRGEVASVSPRTNTAQPPSTVNSNSVTDGLNSTSQLSRLSRFGRRLRMPSSDGVRVVDEETAQQSQEANQAPAPVLESMNMSESINTIHIPTLIPNRELLYGSSSPPILRRHHRRHFESASDASNIRGSLEEQGASAGTSSHLNSSISSDNLDWSIDSFRATSGITAVSSSLHQSGPELESSSDARRTRMNETRSPSRLSIDSSLSSIYNSSPRERRRLYSWQTQPAGERERSSSRDHSSRAEVVDEVFWEAQDETNSSPSQPRQASLELHVPLLGSPLFAPLAMPPGTLLNLLIRTRRIFGQEFMELFLENMMLNVLAHHLFQTDQDGNEDGISGAPPPASEATINNLKEIPALQMHIEQEMKCAICHSEYELYESLTELPCLHFFHPTCVAVWLKKSGTCPVCRFQLSPVR